jgi:transcriptional antiterminator NusG
MTNETTTDDHAKPHDSATEEGTHTLASVDVTPAEPAPSHDTPLPLEPAVLDAEPGTMAEAAANLPSEEEPTEAPISSGEPEPEADQSPTETDAESVSETSAESEAPKPKRTRKPKSAATGADGPSDAPATTDPNAAPSAEPAGGDGKKKWYVVKIQSGREDSIKAAIERKVKIEGLEDYFGQIAIPVEEIVVKKSVKVKDKKTGDKVTQEKKVVKHQKKYPGYLFAEVEFNDRILYLFRETSGVGDFVGAGLKREPTPMTDREVTQMLTGVVDKDAKKPKGPVKVKLDIEKGDKVKIRDGAFANMEGEVKAISEAKEDAETPKVTVVVTIFGRPVEVELDYWHVDKV